MENKRTLKINCAVCDARGVTEEALNAYDEIAINTANIIVTPESQALLNKYRVRINCSNTQLLNKNVRFTTVNGPLSITPGQSMPDDLVYLRVNGPLDIAAGCEEILKGYAGGDINGPVTCPESAAALLGNFKINGPVRAYPDGAIVLKSTTVLDRVFHLRAKQDALYYAPGKVVALAPDINFASLAEKNVRFLTKKLLVSESLAEAALPLFDEKTDIMVLPDGFAYAGNDAELDEVLVQRYGGKLFINGDLTVGPDAAAVLDRVSALRVSGSLLVCRSLKDRVLAMDVEYEDLYVVGGVLIRGRSGLELSAAMLEDAEDGVSVMDCAVVRVAEDIDPKLLKEKLVGISNCASIECTESQRPVMELLARDVASISCGEDEEEADEEDENTVKINAAFYAM